MQIRAARLVTLSKPNYHISPILETLHWLPVKQRIDFKIVCYCYKCFHGSAPTYLEELVCPYRPVRCLRSSDSLLVKKFPPSLFFITKLSMWQPIDFGTPYPINQKVATLSRNLRRILKQSFLGEPFMIVNSDISLFVSYLVLLLFCFFVVFCCCYNAYARVCI